MPNPLRRITTSTRYYPEIDGLRFLAIILVLIFHVGNSFYKTIGENPWEITYGEPLLRGLMLNGDQGVQVFFALSGYILALPFWQMYCGSERRTVKLRSYFLRRLTRLEPPYLLSMLVFFVLKVLYSGVALEEMWPRLLAALFYLNGFIYQDYPPINTVTWSLEVEMQFYLMAPLLVQVFRLPPLARKGALVAGIALMVGVNQFIFTSHGWTLVHYLEFFLVGMLTCDLVQGLPRLKIPLLVEAPLGLMAFWGVFHWNFKYSVFDELLVLLSMLVLFYLTLAGRAWKKAFSVPVFSLIGGMCYSIYLVHFPSIAVLRHFYRPGWGVWGNALWAVPVLIGIGAVFFVLVERPCMVPTWPRDLKNWLLQKQKKRA